MLAVPDATGRSTVYCGGQIPFNDRACIAASLNVPEENIRVVNCLLGGAFGGKEDPIIQIHVALLAHKTKRPVKLVFTRKESLLAHPKRHATIIKMKTGAKKDGTLVAHEVEIYGDGGAYASLSNHVMLRSTTHAAGPYEVSNVRVNTYAMYTNNVPSGAFRGFGVTQVGFAMESQMDELAQELKILGFGDLSPFTLRGILWYQGETDADFSDPAYYQSMADRYVATFAALLPAGARPGKRQICPFTLSSCLK